MPVKAVSRRQIAEMLARSRLALVDARHACADDAAEDQRAASAACGEARDAEAEHRRERGAAWRDARGSFGRALQECAPTVAVARAVAPPGQRRGAGKAARLACRVAARGEERAALRAYYGAKAGHQGAQVERRDVCAAAVGVRHASFAACIEPALEQHAADRRSAEDLEHDRRQRAKRARGGRRPPVSPSERRQEEIDRARADLEVNPEVAAMFERDPHWFWRQWHTAGRRLSLGEWVILYAEENPDLVAAEATEAAEEEAEALWRQYNERRAA